MTRPSLREIPIADALRPGELTVTMSTGQWDALLQSMYSAGCILLELDDNENPVRAFQRRADA